MKALINMPTKLSDQIVKPAIAGFQVQKKRLDQNAELRAMLPAGSAGTGTTTDGAAPKRRKFSPAALRRIREAQRHRWARVRGETEAATKAAELKRRISARTSSRHEKTVGIEAPGSSEGQESRGLPEKSRCQKGD